MYIALPSLELLEYLERKISVNFRDELPGKISVFYQLCINPPILNSLFGSKNFVQSNAINYLLECLEQLCIVNNLELYRMYLPIELLNQDFKLFNFI